MLVATIEIFPYGSKAGRRTISRLFIANMGRQCVNADGERLYRVIKMDDPDDDARATFDETTVGFYHARELGAEECVRAALEALRAARLSASLESPPQ